jgi:mono/diheme cytochrome c family protein/lysophospholipase L1-like esterase
MKRFLLFLTVAICVIRGESAQLDLKNGDHVVLLGNTLAERMQHYGWMESYVQAALPRHKIVFRNHGFSGDRVNERPRNRGFIDPHEYLTISEADVILAFFGYNESYDDDPESYKNELLKWIDETLEKQYNGESAPRIALMSPIAHEDLNDPNLPDGRANNVRLQKYANATAEAAKEKNLPYVDLFAASSKMYAENEEPLTINGVHLNSLGNHLIGKYIAETLFGLESTDDMELIESIREAVLDKNWHWHNRYRATDGNDVWGSRASLQFVDGQTNGEVLMHELEMIDVMTANRDRKVWAHANGVTTFQVDDSNVPPPVNVESNVGGKSPSSSAVKEGSTDYMTPEETLAQLVVPDELEVNVFASEEMFPELANPVQMAVDTKGRLWAAAWKTYPKWEPLKEMNDRLLIFPDRDADGVADEAITFAKVHNPTGFEFWNGGVLVASVPDILFLKDTDGDDVADVRERIFHGLDSADTHHSANAFVYGPDGNFYYQRGVFHVSNVETPWMANQMHTNSAMYRFNPRTFEYSFHANNSPNPHGISFNYWGYQFATDGTGGNAYQVRPDGKGGFRMQKLLDKTVRPVPANGVISSGHFSEKYQGDFLILNSIGFLGIKQYDLVHSTQGPDTDGDGFSDPYEEARGTSISDSNSKPEGRPGDIWGVEVEDLLTSPRDRNFRPTDFEIGSDGAMYVSDWQNIIVGHMQHNIRDPNRDHEYGRIYRITQKNTPLMARVDVDGEPVPHLLDLLTEPWNITRYRARIELSERDTDEVMSALREWVKQWDPEDPAHAHHIVEALWLHQQHNVENQELLQVVLNSPDRDARVAAETVRQFWERDPRKVSPGAQEPVEEPKAMLTSTAELKRRGLTDEEISLYKLGAEVYMREGHCGTCHQINGKGLPKLYPGIDDSHWVGGDPERLTKIVLKGLWGKLDYKGFTYNGPESTTPPMTPFQSLLNDEEIAGVLTYVRNTFSNNAKPVHPEYVGKVRQNTSSRQTFYMVEDILGENPFSDNEVEKNKN